MGESGRRDETRGTGLGGSEQEEEKMEGNKRRDRIERLKGILQEFIR